MFTINTKNTLPEITFSDENCSISITGTSYNMNIHESFSKLISQVKNCNCKKLFLQIDLDFYNTSTVVQISKLIKFLKSKFEKVSVDWFSEEDEFTYDDVEVIEKLTGVKINFQLKEVF
jgi:hypothetical protein